MVSSWFQLSMEVLEGGDGRSKEDEVVEDVVGNDGEEAVKEQGAIGAEHPNIRDELADDSVMDCSES